VDILLPGALFDWKALRIVDFRLLIDLLIRNLKSEIGNSMKSKYLYIGVGVLIGLALTLGVWKVFARSYTYQGSLINPPVPAADFTLTDQQGQPFRLSDQKGEVVLIFFGFTNCSDICPITMAQFKQVKDRLGDLAKDVRFVFITVDPQRDDVEALRSYVGKFDPSFLGLTGDPANLARVWKDYGVYVNKDATDSQDNYIDEHTARIYAIDAKGNWRLSYLYGTETDAIAQDISRLAREN
jgi:protein SCO1/2